MSTTTATASAASSANVIKLDITSDSVCPFCLVGYSRIQQAIRELRATPDFNATFRLRFHPFQLDPTLPYSPGENKLERYERRFGGKEKVAAMVDGMKERGRQLDPPREFSYGGNVSNTKDSHRLIEKAWEVGGEETQLKLVEKFFTLYFEKEADIGSFDVLGDAAVEAGVFSDKTQALAFLKSDELKREVEIGFKQAQQKGISGVPFTIINDQFGISGAQETETFRSVFSKLAKGELKAE